MEAFGKMADKEHEEGRSYKPTRSEKMSTIKMTKFKKENERKAVFPLTKLHKTRTKSEGHGIAWIVNDKNCRKLSGRSLTTMASRPKSTFNKTQQEIVKIELKQSRVNTEDRIRRRGITKGTHTNKSQKKPWKMNIRK